MPDKEILKDMNKNNNIGYRPTWAEIDLRNIEYNINALRRFICKQTQILATVKADAYGHGAVRVSKKLISLGVNYLGVASIDEAIILRKAGISSNILILGGIFPKDADIAIKYDLIQTVYTSDVARSLNSAAKKRNKISRVHIKVDTGMGRLGLWYTDVFSFIKEIKDLKFLNIEGMFTHLSSADTDCDFTNRQIDYFVNLVSKLEANGIHIQLKHIANSLGILDFKHSHLNLVRPGIIIYGLYPRSGLSIKIKPVLSLKTKVIYLKNTPRNRSISYGRSFVTKKKTVIATIPIGYGDGYFRALFNKAEVLVKGKKARVAGSICMDHVMVDVGHIKNIKIGETVTLIGRDKDVVVRAEDLAQMCGTICYEIVCGIGSRVRRVYIDG